ncbi:hypothetical protein ACE6H2_012807 [Prunus campanulata]
MAAYLTMADYIKLKNEVTSLKEQANDAKNALKKALTNVRGKAFVITQMWALNFLVLKRPTGRTGRRVIVMSKAMHFAARATKAKIWSCTISKKSSGRSFKKYTTKLEASRSAKGRYKKARSSLYNFAEKLDNLPVMVATAEEADELSDLTKKFTKTTISVMVPPTASNKVIYTLTTMASAKGFTDLHMQLEFD